ncbi:hypothetical protein C2G38_2184875, partial [Gigaspora rosea]
CDLYVENPKRHQCTYNIIESALEEIQHVQDWKEKMTQEIRNELGLNSEPPNKGKGKETFFEIKEKQKNLGKYTCNICKQPGYTNRYCPENECYKYHEKGHQARDCLEARNRNDQPININNSSTNATASNPSKYCTYCKTTGHENYQCRTSRLLKENANLFCKCNPERIVQRRKEHTNWTTYNEQQDKHHCCRKECNRPTAKEDLYYIKGLFMDPYSLQVIYIEETLYCKGCYSEMHEALDFKDPRSKKYFTGLGQDRKTICRLCEKPNITRKMKSHDGMHFCNKEHKFAQKIFNNMNMAKERLTNQQLDNRIRNYTQNNTNISYHINKPQIKRIIKYMVHYKDNMNKWHHEDVDFKLMNEEYNNDTFNDPEIDEDIRPIRINYFTRIYGQDHYNEELTTEEYKELIDEDEDTELREATFIHESKIREEMKNAEEVLKEQENISLCKECLLPKKKNAIGYCEDCQKEVNAKAINLLIEEESKERSIEKSRQENLEEMCNEARKDNELYRKQTEEQDQMDFEEEIEEIPRSRPTSPEYNTNRKIEELYAIFGLMAEQQFKLTQENKALARRITILEQSTLELQNENQKLKRKLKDTQEHVNLEDLSEDETDEMKQITKEIPDLVTIVETSIYAAIIQNKKILVTAASGKESLYMNPEIREQKKFLRNITKDYIDLQDSSQENNEVKQILSKEELNIKLQGLLDQIKIQIQTLQEQLTLEEAYKNNEYTFLFKRATDQKGRQFSTLYTKERLIKQFKDLKDQLVKEIKRTAHQFKEETKKELTISNTFETPISILSINKNIITYFIPKSKLNEYCYLEFRRKYQRIPTAEELLEGTYNNNKETQKPQLSETEKAYLNRTLLALEGARNIQENDQTTQIIFPNTGLTQATQDYLLQHYTQLILETLTTRRNPRTNNLEIIGTPIITEAIGILLQTAFGQYTKIILLLENYKSEIVKELTTLETPRLKEYYRTALISISVNQEILEGRIKEISIQNIEGEIVDKIIETLLYINNTKRTKKIQKPISTPTRRKKTKRYPRNKDILESRELIQITDDIWETINDLINRINPTNNSRLGAILLTLEGAKSIAREFYPHVLEYDKQRPNKIPAHILIRTQTLFPELTGRALVKEQEKQRNIYKNFLDNSQAQIEGIKKRLLAESPEFCKIFEDNPETGETEFYYGDYNNEFTILPFRFHYLILHHLEAIDNILYSEGARNKIYFEEEENVCVIRECFEETEIVLKNEKLLKKFEETCYSTEEWRAEPCLQKEAKYIVTLAIYLHLLEEPPKHTEPHTLGLWDLYKIKDLLEHRNELIPILEENIELIDGKIKTYGQDVLELPINMQKLKEIKIKLEKQSQRTQETFNFLNDIDLEIPEEEIPEIVDKQFPVLALNFGKKSYKGLKYLSIFDKVERKIIAQKFGENPTIAELSKDDTILYKFQNTGFEFEIHKSSTNKLTYLKLRLSKDQTQTNDITYGKQTWEFFHKNYSKLPLI